MAPPSKYDPKFCDELIQHMSEGFSFESFAAKVSVSRATLYNWRDGKPEFSEAFGIGEMKSLAWWELAASMAVRGKIEGFNATVWIFTLKNRFGWRDRAPEDNGDKGEPLVIKLPNAKETIVIAQPGQTVPKGIN